ncbi:YjcZ family sporulation protein [Peribacillus loiseleuriae]
MFILLIIVGASFCR